MQFLANVHCPSYYSSGNTCAIHFKFPAWLDNWSPSEIAFGDPQPTPVLTVAQLKSLGYIGVYKKDNGNE